MVSYGILLARRALGGADLLASSVGRGLEEGSALVLAGCLALIGSAVGFAAARRRAHRRDVLVSRLNADVLSAVRHELSSPLTTLRLSAEILAEPGLGADERERHRAALLGEADRIERLIGLLVASARNVARGRGSGEGADLARIVANALADVEPLRGRRDVALAAEIPAALPVVGEAEGIEAAFAGIVDAVVRFVDPGEALSARLEPSRGGAALIVETRGDGLSGAPVGGRTPRAFAGSSGVPLVEGADLRLYLAGAILRSFGGSVEATWSKSGDGILVKAWLPGAQR